MITAAVLLFGLTACHNPEEFHPNVDRAAIDNITAKFLDDDRDENEFKSEIDHENGIITVVFPYNYPRLSDKVLTMDKLTKMRVEADLDNNAYVTPPLMYMDLTKENFIQVTDQVGNVKDYKVVAEIRKSNECAITEFNLIDPAFTGIINESAKTISLLTLDEIKGALATVSLSHGATISPDPTKTPMDYIDPVEFTVTAQNGTDKAVYTVKRDTPNKLSSGFRKGSEKLIWAKKLADIGYTAENMQTGIAVAGNYLVINERANANAVYLNLKTGDVAGKINISSIAGSLTNFYVTSDNAGNILFNNFVNDGTKFTIYRMRGVDGTLEKYIEIDAPAVMGRKVSVIGDLDKDAIITAAHDNAAVFSRWQVKNGALVSATPETVAITGGPATWSTHADVIHTDPSDAHSDYFVTYYAEPRYSILVNGQTNAVKAHDYGLRGETAGQYSANWVMNAVDYTEFNKGKYMITNSVNSFTWGTDDRIRVFDVTAGNLDTHAIDFTETGMNIDGNYGAKALGLVNGNGTGDVRFHVSEDGFYMYIYFMFTNGYVGCVQVDCIDM